LRRSNLLHKSGTMHYLKNHLDIHIHGLRIIFSVVNASFWLEIASSGSHRSRSPSSQQLCRLSMIKINALHRFSTPGLISLHHCIKDNNQLTHTSRQQAFCHYKGVSPKQYPWDRNRLQCSPSTLACNNTIYTKNSHPTSGTRAHTSILPRYHPGSCPVRSKHLRCVGCYLHR
jgi:hypothetical protein